MQSLDVLRDDCAIGVVRRRRACARGFRAEIESDCGSGSAEGWAAVALTLKRAIELALENSKEIQVAKIQASVADRAAQITKAQFMPNLYAGSARVYLRHTGNRAGAHHRSSRVVHGADFQRTAEGQAKETQEQSKAQKIALEDAKNSVITRTAMAYLEWEGAAFPRAIAQGAGKRGEDSASDAGSSRGRIRTARRSDESAAHESAGDPANLATRRREDELEVFLRYQLGFPEAQAIEVTPEELPGKPSRRETTL